MTSLADQQQIQPHGVVQAVDARKIVDVVGVVAVEEDDRCQGLLRRYPLGPEGMAVKAFDLHFLGIVIPEPPAGPGDGLGKFRIFGLFQGLLGVPVWVLHPVAGVAEAQIAPRQSGGGNGE